MIFLLFPLVKLKYVTNFHLLLPRNCDTNNLIVSPKYISLRFCENECNSKFVSKYGDNIEGLWVFIDFEKKKCVYGSVSCITLLGMAVRKLSWAEVALEEIFIFHPKETSLCFVKDSLLLEGMVSIEFSFK